MIECGFLLECLRINDNELVSAFHGLPVPEPAGVLDRVCRIGDVYREALKPIAQFRSTFVVSGCDLRKTDYRHNQQQPQRKNSDSHAIPAI
jgi:hypothetical protein